MSANRRMTAVPEMTFSDFLERCRVQPIVRVQGKQEASTARNGRLVRFNRAVRVDPNRVKTNRFGNPYIYVERVKWNRHEQCFVGTGEWMTVTWRCLDWITWDMSHDPNGEWLKVTGAE